ncbi:hypothetical protein PLICRDRAFT_180576 [Plicaturopsis crispa FD-325 SS-3]|uniref:Uncharacterized protein n=1 Tax=Plicaturopsis crispa FD-325 SS-3 TaxID=944288 RepID=A0A0C9SQ45_PLICR|nr:hypothetical protein PLICRDRAFT_180576 [Plicaturopsis crispa FD-325 SS-3]
MSLPAATKDISNKPAAGSVVDPVNSKQKDADVDRKIRLYGVIEAFRQGRLPDNKQIDETLAYVLANSPVDADALSPGGRALIADARDIIETARLIVREKNADELFQNFVWHTRGVDIAGTGAKKDPADLKPVDGEKARDDGQIAVQHLRTILSLVLTNSEVRKLLSDFSLIGRDLLARGASKAAGSLAPDPARLAAVDDAAPQDQFVTADGRHTGPNETPVLQARVPGTDRTVERHPREGETRVRHENGSVQTGGEAYREGEAKARELKERGDVGGEDVSGLVDRELSDEDEETKKGFMDRARAFKTGLTDRIPQQHKDKANAHFDRGKQFLSEEYFPEERRDQFIYRGKKVIIECQKHDDYQESLKWLLSYLEEYVHHAQTLAAHGKDTHQSLTSDPALKQSTHELRTLLERFANGRSISTIIDALNALIEDARTDESLRAWFASLDTYARRVLLDAGFVLEPQCNSQGRDLRESGRQFYEGTYKAHFDNLFESVGAWFGAMGEDKLNRRFGEDWARLTRDLLFDAEGSLKFKPDLWNDIRKVILPTLIDKVGYVPIPRIEYTDDALDLVVENLTLSGRNLFPNHVSLEAHNFVKFSPYDAIADEHHHEVTLTFAQIQADMRDVAFYFNKKSGMKLKDSGLADVVLGGSGLTATVHLVSSDRDPTSVFKVKNVSVKVDSLKFSIRDSKHDFLYRVVRPLATGLVKKQIQKAFADAITTGMEYADGQLVGVRDRVKEAGKEGDGKGRMEALQQLFNHKKEETTSTVKSSEGKSSQFKVVGNKRNSILAGNVGHPSGWANRTAEKEERALEGKEWHSASFNIVNA